MWKQKSANEPLTQTSQESVLGGDSGIQDECENALRCSSEVKPRGKKKKQLRDEAIFSFCGDDQCWTVLK